MGENFSYCISNYFKNTHNYTFNEELVFVLGSCHNLSLLSKNTGHVVNFNNDLLATKSFYISGTNTLALQNFATVINSVLRVEPRNGTRDLKWIINDYYNLEGAKTLITLPNSIIKEKKKDSPQLIYSLVHPIGESTEEPFSNKKINFELDNKFSIELTGSKFLKYWENTSNSRPLGINRFVIIPPTFHDFSKSMRLMIINSLTRNVLNLNRENNEIGPNLFLNLVKDLNLNKSPENLNLHKRLLIDSIEINSISGQYDMSRNYAGKCFDLLGKQLNMKGFEKSSILFKKSGLIWSNTYSELNINPMVSADNLKNIYNELYNAEKNILYSLKSILKK
ncbi:hypothetical protein PXC01_05595 [Maribacter sp. M208]|uniref:hypothetical protein n=1 Tax=Maribacter huludaoensis TaxID=3030010 RepID=UPI0023EBA00A|nr:hypothetical protein [Maribacter huludaoensis]MDF4221052.1 hypothetical protein [Maribacter huludaoensis]